MASFSQPHRIYRKIVASPRHYQLAEPDPPAEPVWIELSCRLTSGTKSSSGSCAASGCGRPSCGSSLLATRCSPKTENSGSAEESPARRKNRHLTPMAHVGYNTSSCELQANGPPRDRKRITINIKENEKINAFQFFINNESHHGDSHEPSYYPESHCIYY